jgi:hypothetical protein
MSVFAKRLNYLYKEARSFRGSQGFDSVVEMKTAPGAHVEELQNRE